MTGAAANTPGPDTPGPDTPGPDTPGPDTPAALRLARHVAGLAFADLPPAAVAAAKTFLLDSLGVGIAGATAPGADRVRAAAARWGAGQEAALWGTGARLPASSAAFVNGFQLHGQEFDCVHEGAVLHPMATLLPAALGWAEREGGITGTAFLTALAAGVDVAVALGLAATGALRFFRPATAGGFGAVAATARLAGFDATRIADAMGLLYAQTSGTMQPHIEASVALPLQPGFNARAALCAADLAGAGLSGPHGAIDGPFGYLTLFEAGFDLAPVWAALAGARRITELSHKPFPAGRATHGGIEGVAHLRAAHGFAPAEIAGVVVRAPPLIARLCGRPAIADPDPAYARLCMGFVIAKTLLEGALDPTHFRGPALRDPTTFALARRVVTESDGTADPNALAPQEVTITLTDGRTLVWQAATMLAHPSRPLSREAHLAKFRRCWSLAAIPLGAPEALIEMVEDLEQLDDMRRLAALLGG